MHKALKSLIYCYEWMPQWAKFVPLSYITIINSNLAGNRRGKERGLHEQFANLQSSKSSPFSKWTNLLFLELGSYWKWSLMNPKKKLDFLWPKTWGNIELDRSSWSHHFYFFAMPLQRRRLEMAWTNVKMAKKSGLLGCEHGSSR